MKALSLFAGVGGFDLAAQRAGIDAAAHCELDPAARQVLRRRFPDALSFDDVRTLTADDLRTAGAVPDLLCGGFPCQDLSVAGHRKGLAGARSGLFYDLARLAADLHPRWVVLENVPGLLSSNDGRDMGAVLGTLGSLGYGFAYRVLDAQHFGVPQRRRRVFIVGCLGDRAAPVEVLLEPEGSGDDPGAQRTTRQAAAGSLADSPGGRGGERADGDQADAGRLTGDRPQAYTVHGEHSTAMTGAGVAQVAFRTETARNLDTTGGYATNQGGTIVAHPGGDGPTVRRLTPTECERLQGFPDGWTDGLADSHRYRQMGNAVAVPVVEWVLRRVLAVDARLPSVPDSPVDTQV